MRGLSLVAASGDHSSSRCADLSLSRPLLLRSTGSRRAGSVVVAHGLSCSAACGILPDQGSNPYPLHWQADSQPLRHQGSPAIIMKCAIKISLLWSCSMVLFTFLYVSLCANFWGVCSFPRNWLQSLGWDSESGRFLEKSREAWHPQNRNNDVHFVGTPMWDCSWSRSATHIQAAHYSLLAPRPLTFKEK